MDAIKICGEVLEFKDGYQDDVELLDRVLAQLQSWDEEISATAPGDRSETQRNMKDELFVAQGQVAAVRHRLLNRSDALQREFRRFVEETSEQHVGTLQRLRLMLARG